MMHGRVNRQFAQILFCLTIMPLVALLSAGEFHFAAAEEPDATGEETKTSQALEIEIGDEGVTVRAPGGKLTKRITKSLIVAGDSIDMTGLDSALITIESGSIIKFGEPVIIKKGEVVDGDLVSFGGPITVAGTVNGDVAAIGTMIHVLSTGVIRGDVQTFGGSVQRDPGGQIRGQQMGVVPIHIRTKLPFLFIRQPLSSLLSFGVPLIVFIVFSLLLAALATLVAPRNVEKIRETIEELPLKSFLVGLIAAILFLPLFLLLCITIIGIPVALIVLPFAYFVAKVMGFAGISLFMSGKLQRGSSPAIISPTARVIIGALVLELPFIVAWIFISIGGFLGSLFRPFLLIGWLIIILGGIILSVAMTIGMGAAIWTRLGKRSIAGPPGVAPPGPPPLSPEPEGDLEKLGLPDLPNTPSS